MPRTPLALCAVVALVSACGKPPLEPRDPDPGAFHFTVETYNMLDEAGGDVRTLATLGEMGADIVCVRDHARVASSYRIEVRESLCAHDVPRRTGACGSRGAWHSFKVPRARRRMAPSSKRMASGMALLRRYPHGTIKVLNAHLRNAVSDHGSAINSYLTTAEDHRYEITVFTAANVTKFPTLIMGDFNEGPDGAAVQYLENVGFQNVLPLYHPGQPTHRHRSVAGQFSQELDHILFDSSFASLNAWVVNDGNSDHLPVMAHFEALDPW